MLLHRILVGNSFPHGLQVLNDKDFAQLMDALDIDQPSDEALAHLKVPPRGTEKGRQARRAHGEKLEINLFPRVNLSLSL